MLVLDHIFVCVQRDAEELARMRKLGFTSSFSRVHAGQGTANDLILFERNYLELLFVNDRAEAQSSLVRLDQRCDWRRTGACPFGVALRGPRSSVHGVDWQHYSLPGMTGGLWIAKASLDDPRLPMVFVFDRPDGAVGGPVTGGYAPELLQHACGAIGIDDAEITGRGFGAAPALALPKSVRLVEGASPQLRLKLQGWGSPAVKVGPLVELS